jgi:hypothetical protein
MVLMTLGKVLTSVYGSPRGNREAEANSVQVARPGRMFWVTKPVIIRNVPITAFMPTENQVKVRINFGETAHRLKGTKGTDRLKYDSRSGKHKAGDTVLAIQSKMQDQLRGKTFATTPAPKKLYHIHSLEELEAKYGGATGGTR